MCICFHQQTSACQTHQKPRANLFIVNTLYFVTTVLIFRNTNVNTFEHPCNPSQPNTYSRLKFQAIFMLIITILPVVLGKVLYSIVFTGKTYFSNSNKNIVGSSANLNNYTMTCSKTTKINLYTYKQNKWHKYNMYIS